MRIPHSPLDPKKRYLQVALNSTLEEAYRIIHQLPVSDRIILEAGTPLIKRYGEEGIRKIREWYAGRSYGLTLQPKKPSKIIQAGELALPLPFSILVNLINRSGQKHQRNRILGEPAFYPYVVADLKMMDRGETEVEIAWRAGASAVTALGCAPEESLNAFIEKCDALGLDAMIDMMNVPYPLAVLRALKKQPRVVVLHRGVDEERLNKEKQLPLHEIRRIKGNYDMMIAVAGGDSLREVQSVVFNDADIVVVWKEFFQSSAETGRLAKEFLETVK